MIDHQGTKTQRKWIQSLAPWCLCVVILFPSAALARGKDYCETCARDKRGHIERNQKAVREFKRQNPCPATGRTTGACPGYVIDHVIPLKRGGPDRAENMQWQTTRDAKEKDKVE